MNFAKMDAPDGAVFVVLFEIGGGKVHGDEGGVGPV